MSQYYYPKVQGGYRWNMLQRIKNTIGIEPFNSGDSGDKTFLEFDRSLTSVEKERVDDIMNTSPTFPPSTINTIFQIKDIWEIRDEFKSTINDLPFEIYFSESDVGSGIINRIELHFKKKLNDLEKIKVKTEYANLIQEKL